MGVESFFLQNPADEDLRWIVKARESAVTHESIISYFASLMIDAGRTELQRLASRYMAREDLLEVPSQLDLNRIFGQTGVIQYAAIYLGCSVVTLEKGIWAGELDISPFIARLQEGFRGTPFIVSQSNNQRELVEVISSEQHKQMSKVAGTDKTLAIFFRQPELMPGNLRAFLTDRGMFGRIRRWVLDDYESRAKVLVSQENHDTVS